MAFTNLCSIDVMSIIYLHRFLLLIMHINLRSICHLNISTYIFSIKKENDNCLLFLNIKIFVKMENLQLMFSEKRSSLRYRPTSRVLYRKYKIGLIKSLLFWCFSFSYDVIKLIMKLIN